jgi:hypothetical protein
MHLYAGNDSASVRLENTANSKVWEITPANPGVANSGLSIYNVTDDVSALHVDNSNNLLVGQSSQSVPGFSNNTVGHSIRANGDIFSSCSAGTAMYANRSTNDGVVVSFRRQGNGVGSVSVTSSGATYNTTSDIRLKQDIEPLQATDKLMQMNPVSYNWKLTLTAHGLWASSLKKWLMSCQRLCPLLMMT